MALTNLPHPEGARRARLEGRTLSIQYKSTLQNELLPKGTRARGAALDDDPDRRYLVAGRQIAGGAWGRRLRGGELGLWWSDENDSRRCRADSGCAINAQPIDETEWNAESRRSPVSGKIPTADRDKAAEGTIENQNAACGGSVRDDTAGRPGAHRPRNGGTVRCHAPCRCRCDRQDDEHGAQYYEGSPCAHRKSPWTRSPRNCSLTSFFAPWNLCRPGWHSSIMERASPIRDRPKTKAALDMSIFSLTLNP
jgi:hypothetical protein